MDLSQEKELISQGKKIVTGIDEAGRGPLAGPVVAAIVIFAPDFDINSSGLELIKDSKKLSAKQREKLFPLIIKQALAVSLGTASHATIDRINILQASFLVMRKALNTLSVQPDHILIDGHLKIPKVEIEQTAIVDGDAKIFSIAAASIIAKVSRDYLMLKLDKQYPEYGFSKHKGHGTKLHLERLKKIGPCPIHRLSFKPLNQKNFFIKKEASEKFS